MIEFILMCIYTAAVTMFAIATFRIYKNYTALQKQVDKAFGPYCKSCNVYHNHLFRTRQIRGFDVSEAFNDVVKDITPVNFEDLPPEKKAILKGSPIFKHILSNLTESIIKDPTGVKAIQDKEILNMVQSDLEDKEEYELAALVKKEITKRTEGK